MGRIKVTGFLAVAAIGLLCASCSQPGSAGYVRRTTSAANDHIMFVRQQPQTFGHQRLNALSSLYPDLALFIRQQGLPDFIAETNKSGNRYLILYYLSSRKAFACRSGPGNSRQVEFSGPYPVTDSEFKTLDAIRKKSEPSPASLRKNFTSDRN